MAGEWRSTEELKVFWFFSSEKNILPLLPPAQSIF
jgi:hypothetical protein